MFLSVCKTFQNENLSFFSTLLLGTLPSIKSNGKINAADVLFIIVNLNDDISLLMSQWTETERKVILWLRVSFTFP